ncbi:MAG: DUF1573 domain-containing protein [Planctomycetia bacterium]
MGLLVVALASASQATGSAWNLLDYARGQRLFVGGSTLDLGDVTSGEPTSLAIPIRNASSSAVKIIGVTTTCSCLQPIGLPATVAPRATQKLEFELMPGKPNPDFELLATVITDAPGQFQIPLVVRGVIKAAPSPSQDEAPSVLHSPAPTSEAAQASEDEPALSNPPEGGFHAAQ